MNKPILSFSNEYSWLSNFFPVSIVYENIVYPTVEHAFQAAKTLNISEREKIAAAITPGVAKRIGRQVKLRSDWEKVKINIMAELLHEKFKNGTLREKLLATGDAYLEEGNSWHDNFWGNCDGNGLNWLGKLLMQERTRLGDEDGICNS